MAEALRARGLATIVVDLLTEREEHLDRIDSSLRFDIDMLAERLLAVTTWVLDESSLSHLPLAYVGDGTAAAAALCAASRKPERSAPWSRAPAAPISQAPRCRPSAHRRCSSSAATTTRCTSSTAPRSTT